MLHYHLLLLLTSSTLQMMVPSGISPRGMVLPMDSTAFLPQYRNCSSTNGVLSVKLSDAAIAVNLCSQQELGRQLTLEAE